MRSSLLSDLLVHSAAAQHFCEIFCAALFDLALSDIQASGIITALRPHFHVTSDLWRKCVCERITIVHERGIFNVRRLIREQRETVIFLVGGVDEVCWSDHVPLAGP